jgi:hypothetical protein
VLRFDVFFISSRVRPLKFLVSLVCIFMMRRGQDHCGYPVRFSSTCSHGKYEVGFRRRLVMLIVCIKR